MPSHTLNNGVRFFYTDSGPVDGDYTTCLFIYGHTFHNGRTAFIYYQLLLTCYDSHLPAHESLRKAKLPAYNLRQPP